MTWLVRVLVALASLAAALCLAISVASVTALLVDHLLH